MNAIDAITGNMDMAKMICQGYLGDLSEEELMHRPAPKSNHIKWQMGHLLASDNQIINGLCPGAMEPLPEGFVEKYSKEQSASDDASAFHSKDELMALYEKQDAAIRAALGQLSESELDQPGPEEMKQYAPTVGAGFNLVGMHWVMHAGQWAVIRRQLGREPLF